MASAAHSLRLGMRRCCAAPTFFAATTTRAATQPLAHTRGFASTPRRRAAGDDGGSGKEQPLEAWEIEQQEKEEASQRITSITEALRSALPADQAAKLPQLSQQEREREARFLAELRQEFYDARRVVPRRRDAFWNDEEADAEMVTSEVGEDEFHGDDITSMAHGKLEELRERRHYLRIAAWEMPLLSKLAKPFEPPTADMKLRFRYTSYMGEFHPAEKKVVVEFCPADLDLTEAQQNKLKKLVGSRYNPEKETVRMSCEMHEHQAQNKRHLGDLIEKLIAEARDPTDTFEDIPLDTRHHTFKTKPKFPREWRMTDERRKALQAVRAESFLQDQQRLKEGSLVDGAQAIRAALAPPAQDLEQVAEMVRLQ